MIKRLAAAVLLAMANLVGSANAADDDPDNDLDSSGETRNDFRKAGHVTDASVALADLSIACDELIDAAWIARDSVDHSAAAVTVHRTADHVAAVTLAVEADCPAWTDMLSRALMFCRDEEAALKVIVKLEGVSAAPVASIATLQGFQVARVRQGEGANVIECYTDLYWNDATAAAKV